MKKISKTLLVLSTVFIISNCKRIDISELENEVFNDNSKIYYAEIINKQDLNNIIISLSQERALKDVGFTYYLTSKDDNLLLYVTNIEKWAWKDELINGILLHIKKDIESRIESKNIKLFFISKNLNVNNAYEITNEKFEKIQQNNK